MFGILAQSEHNLSTIGVEITWARCRDGVELHDYGSVAVPKFADEPRFSLTGALSGRWIRNRSTEVQLYNLRLADLKNPLFEKFINCKSPQDFVEFVRDYGIPGPSSYDGLDASETELSTLESVRDGIRRVMDKSVKGSPYECSSAYNSFVMSLRGTALKPLLAIWRNTSAPSLCFQPVNLYGYMAMEVAMAISSAAALRTCLHCSSAFLAGPLTSKRSNAYYCSNRCRVAAQRAKVPLFP